MIRAIVLFILLCHITVAAHAKGCVSEARYRPIATQPQTSLLYAVHDCDTQKVSYLFGTLHTSAVAVMQRIAFILPYLAQARHAWFEIIPTSQEQATLQKMMLIPAGSPTLDSLLPKAQFNTLLGYFQRNNPQMTAPLLAQYTPWAAAIALQVLDIDMSGMVMDDQLQHYAKQKGVAIHALERAEDQLALFARLTPAEQLQLLQMTIKDYASIQSFTKEMITYYKARSLHKVAAIAMRAMQMNKDKMSKKLEQWLVHDRNKAMMQTLLPALKQGDIFVAVGALHLSGDTGLLAQCEQAGFQIEEIAP